LFSRLWAVAAPGVDPMCSTAAKPHVADSFKRAGIKIVVVFSVQLFTPEELQLMITLVCEGEPCALARQIVTHHECEVFS